MPNLCRVYLETHQEPVEVLCDHYKWTSGYTYFFGNAEETVVNAFFVKDQIVGIIGKNPVPQKKGHVSSPQQEEVSSEKQLLVEGKVS